MRKITSFLTTMILSLVASIAMAQDFRHGDPITDIGMIKDGTPFMMARGDQYLCFPDAQNAAMKGLDEASSTNAYYFNLESPQPMGDKAVPEEISDKYIIRVLDGNRNYWALWGNSVNSYLNNAGWIMFTLTLNNQWGQDKLYGGVWNLQYVEGQGWTLYNVGFAGYVNDAGGTSAEPQYWTLYFADDLSSMINNAEAISGSRMNADISSELLAAIDNAKNATAETESEAFLKLKDAMAKAKPSINFYASLESLYNSMNNLDDSGKAKLAEDDACASFLEAWQNCELDETVSSQEYKDNTKEGLKAAVLAQTTPGADFSAVIANPEINGADGWTTERPLGGNGPLLNNSSFEYWAGNASDRSKASFDYYQVITGLPNGAYTVTADMYNSLNDEAGAEWNATSGVYGKGANESITLVNEDGATLKPYTTDKVVVEDGTIRIGVKNTVTPMAARWFVADNFKLTYLGPVASEEDLAPLTAEIANAKLLGVDVSAWEGKTFAASEVSAAIEAVKEAEYKSVLAAYPLNAGSLIPAFDAWEGGMVSNKGQHWDGTGTSTYYEQSGNQYGQASWTNSKTTTVKLPKGQYVIYAAGRNSAGTACTSYIKVNDKTQIFPAKGDTGFGIATDGTATFDPSATYANNNAGRGWEYRYIAFEVTAEEGESVTLTVGGEATAQKQWMSVCVPVLLTTSDNAAIAKQTLAADIVAAQAIVDAKAGVGEGLFLIPEEAFSTFSAAVEAAKAVNDNAEATGEELAAAIAALAAATKTYKATPVNVPAADKQYTLSLKTSDEASPFQLSIAQTGISIAEVGTPVTFVAKEGGKFALSNGTESIYYTGANSWSLGATAEEGEAWTITALADGTYTITGKNGFLGTNTKDGSAAGSTCYGDKKSSNGFYIWAISEYVAPAPVLVYTDLAVEDYYTWSAADATGEKVNQCPTSLLLNESTGLPFGDGNVHYLNYVDLSDAVNMVVTATEGTPRMLFNRVEDGGTVNVELPRDAAEYWTEVDNGDGSKTYTVDVKKIVANFGFAHLHCIKGANWANTTVTSVKIGREEKAPVEPTTYAIAIAEGIENGTIAADVETAEEGATVTLTATPAEGYKLEAITVTAGEASVEVTEAEGAYTFVMPAAAVTVSATFAAEAVEPTPELPAIAQEFTSIEEIAGQSFVIINKQTGKILFGTDAQNLGYDNSEAAIKETNSGYNFKLDTPAVDAEDETIANCYLLRLMTPAGEAYNIWGNPGYLNSQPATGNCSFILGLNNQNGQDIKNGAVWDIQYVEGKGFTLLNKGTGLYLNDNAPAKYDEPVYWTFCTLQAETEPELAKVENMTLTVAEDAVIKDDKTFPVVFGYTATVDESIAAMAPAGWISYTVTAEGKEPINGGIDFDVDKDARNIWIPGLDNETDYTITINSVSVSYFDFDILDSKVVLEKKFEAGELTASFNTGVPVGINGVAAGAKANRKVVENGRVVIYKNGVKTMSSGVSIR